ncbi:MAG: hypothetical protein ACR65O_10210 [Methylomicrobium sp.]|jgi:hypothetical protein
MYKFGLATEGKTDQFVLENIICGYFEDPDLDAEITELQPHLDETDRNQKCFGGWEMLLDYIKSARFREDVINVKHVVLQLDTDIIEHPNFGSSYRDNNGSPLTHEQLIDNTIDKLVSFINSGVEGFYEKNKEKIIFAICIHSIECWLYAFFNNEPLKSPKTTGCGRALEFLLKKNGFDKNKDKELYKAYSKIFLVKKNIHTATEKSPSFKYFTYLLEKIPKTTSQHF